MKPVKVLSTTALVMSLLLAGCGDKPAAQPQDNAQTQTTQQPAAQEEAKKSAVADLVGATKELVGVLKAEQVDWDKAIKLYDEKLKSHVQSMDEANSAQVNEQITAALNAGKDGQLPAKVVAQIGDKLLQKVAFLSIRNEFKGANDQFANKDEAKKELGEAKEYYNGVLKAMIEKRDNAYETQLVSAIDAGFAEMEGAIEKGDNLAFNLGKQVVDKSIMKAFYLASGAEKGYAYKIEKLVKEGKADDARVGQAEGWAFFQSLQSYLEKHDKKDADFINSQFDLSNDVKNVKGDTINQAYVRAIAKTAKSEYEASVENWGNDKAAITALEGALFIDMIKTDLPKALGSAEKADALHKLAQQYLDAVKAQDKAKADESFKQIKPVLDLLETYGK